MSKGREIRMMVKRGYRQSLKNSGTLDCGICHTPIRFQSDLSLDHILPKYNGGKNELNNFQPTHEWCNVKKGHKYQHQVEATQ